MSKRSNGGNGDYGIDINLGDMGDRPQFRVLSDEKLDQIHDATAEVLATVGVQVPDWDARDMMGAAGCGVEDDIVRIPRRVLEDSISSAPKKIMIYDREGNEALELGSNEVYTHTGYTPLECFDIDSGERRDYTLEDFRIVSRVADALPNVDMIGQPGVVRPSPEDPLEVINQLEMEAMLTNTSKPIHVLVADGEILTDCLEMAEAIAVANGARSLAEKPFVLPFQNPISPLFYNQETIDKLFISVDWGVPVICGPMTLAGGTAPVTIAGSIIQANAEALVGLVMSQIRRPGSPYVMLPAPATINMRTGDVVASPEANLMGGGVVEMGHYYGVPVQVGGAGSGGRGILDAEAGWQQMFGGLCRMMSGANAGIGVGAGPSIEACVMADEMIGMLKVMMKGVVVDDDTLALDAIRDVGPGGVYLGHHHTYAHFREFWQPSLMANISYEGWEAGGSMSIQDRVKERLQEIIATHKPRPIPAEAQTKIDEIIARARARAAA